MKKTATFMELPLLLLLICFCHQVESNPTLDSTPPGGSTLYNNQPISVTCTTRGSQVLIWESEEYIGQGNHVTVASSDQPGTTIPCFTDLEVAALVISTSNTPGEEMIESLLKINVTSTYPNFTITCRNNDLGRTDSVSYHTTDELGVELIVTDQRVCPGGRVCIKCFAKNTILTQWNTDFGTDPIYCQDNDDASRNLTVNGVPIVQDKHYSVNPDGTTILTCGLTFNVDDLPCSDVGEQLSFTCKNNDLDISINKKVEIANICVSANTTRAVNFDVSTVNTEELTMSHASTLATSKVVNIVFFLGLAMLILCVT